MKIFVLNNCRRYCWFAVPIVLFPSFKKGNFFDNLCQETVNQLGDFLDAAIWKKKTPQQILTTTN